MGKWYKYLILGFLALTTAFAQAKVILPHFFSDNMVLQRDMPIHIWGQADKNEMITVKFNGFVEKSRPDKTGRWDFRFPVMKYGGPLSLSILGNDTAIVFDNILIGDVWLCSGQSNMEFQLSGDYTASNEIKASENKKIRLLKVPRNIQTQEKEDIPATFWMECDPATSADFSAIAYFFGKNLQKELDIPMGLIEDCFGGTNIETWTSWEASMNNDLFAKYKGQTIEKVFGHSGDELNNIFSALFLRKDDGIINKWFLPETDKAGWKKMYAPKAWDEELKEEDGVVWFRKEITLPESVDAKTAKLHLGISGSDLLYLNGELVNNPSYMDMDNYVFEGKVKAGINYIYVRFLDLGGASGFRRIKPEDFCLETDGIKFFLAGDWEYKSALLTSKFRLETLYLPNNFASLLYNGMIHPLIGYGIKGAIWYQGEGNLGEAYKYRKLFPNLISDWRKQWGYDFPFIWAQLTSFQPEADVPEESGWAELREAQNMTLSLPNTGQAVITDIGDAVDIHPKNKKDVGYRLAQNALKVAYGKNILGAGPAYENMKVDDNKVILRFSNTGIGLSTRDNNKYGYLHGFSVAGDDKKFVWAKAFIEGDNVIVFSDKVAKPMAVRYGWANNPTEINLTNSDGLLASPFRTDNWQCITEH